MRSALPYRARALRTGDITLVMRNTAQARTEEIRAADRTPNFASTRSSPRKANVAISSETVNPIPEIMPPPKTAAHPTGGRIRPPVTCETNQDVPAMPSGFPTTKPTTIPTVKGAVAAEARTLPSISMPAFANPNKGTMR